MNISDKDILRMLMKSRDRIAAATWIIVRDAQTAEDIFQNVAIKAMTKDVEFKSAGELISWAFVTARRESIDWVRRHKKEASIPDTKLMEILEEEWQSDETREDSRLEALRSCVESLPGKLADLLRLRYFDGLSCGKVGEKIGIGLDAVYKRLSRVHQSLRDCVRSRLGKQEAIDNEQ